MIVIQNNLTKFAKTNDEFRYKYHTGTVSNP